MDASRRRPAASGRCYAGIGSRGTPGPVLARMQELAAGYARAGWTLRTGGSPGADQAFLAGALEQGGEVELYLPRPGFEQAALSLAAGRARILERPARAAYELAETFHPHWAGLTAPERALLARDVHQILGASLLDPAAVVICWTAGGSLDGEALLEDGTGQALRVAAARGVPAVNLGG